LSCLSKHEAGDPQNCSYHNGFSPWTMLQNSLGQATADSRNFFSPVLVLSRLKKL
jgi:hypothetical protein